MAEELKPCRAEFEAAILAETGQAPGNYNPEFDRYVSERRQGQYEGWKLARTQAPSQGGEAAAWVQVVPVSEHQPCKPQRDCENGYKIPLYTHQADPGAVAASAGSAELVELLGQVLAFDHASRHDQPFNLSALMARIDAKLATLRHV